jgi:hypothetical protein
VTYRLDMSPTEMRTQAPPLLGQQAAPIVPRAPWWQRAIVGESNDGGAGGSIFLTSDSSELSSAGGGALPGQAMQLVLNDVVVLSIAPGQSLMAATNVAGSRVTVSISGEIPAVPDPMPQDESTFRTYTLPPLGNSVRVAPTSIVPRRVAVRTVSGATPAFLAANSGALTVVGSLVPGDAFELPQAFGWVVFVLPPHQALYAASGGVTNEVSVVSSDIQPGGYRGGTGIPGPGSQE